MTSFASIYESNTLIGSETNRKHLKETIEKVNTILGELIQD